MKSLFLQALGLTFLVLVTQIERSQSDEDLIDELRIEEFGPEGISSSSVEDPSNRVLPIAVAEEVESIDIIEDDYQEGEEEYPGQCVQVLRNRLLRLLKTLQQLNVTRSGRQEDGDGEGDGDGDGDGDGAAAGAAAAGAGGLDGLLGLDVPPVVPQILKVVGSAFTSNNSANALGSISKTWTPIVQNQILGAVSFFANVLGLPTNKFPTPTRPSAPIRNWPLATTKRTRPTQTPIRRIPPPALRPFPPIAPGPPPAAFPIEPPRAPIVPPRSPIAPVLPPREPAQAFPVRGSLTRFYSTTAAPNDKTATELESVHPTVPVVVPDGFASALLSSISQSFASRRRSTEEPSLSPVTPDVVAIEEIKNSRPAEIPLKSVGEEINGNVQQGELEYLEDLSTTGKPRRRRTRRTTVITTTVPPTTTDPEYYDYEDLSSKAPIKRSKTI